MSPKRYDEEFKRKAVDLLLIQGKSFKPLAQDLGLSAATFRYWRDKRLGSMPPSADGKPSPSISSIASISSIFAFPHQPAIAAYRSPTRLTPLPSRPTQLPS